MTRLTESYDGYRARLRALAADETYADVHGTLSSAPSSASQQSADPSPIPGAILGAFPFFDSIHTLCSNDPQFLPTAERPDWRTHWRPIKGAPGDYERAVERCLERLEAEEDDEDRMSGELGAELHRCRWSNR